MVYRGALEGVHIGPSPLAHSANVYWCGCCLDSVYLEMMCPWFVEITPPHLSRLKLPPSFYTLKLCFAWHPSANYRWGSRQPYPAWQRKGSRPSTKAASRRQRGLSFLLLMLLRVWRVWLLPHHQHQCLHFYLLKMNGSWKTYSMSLKAQTLRFISKVADGAD